MSSSGVVEVFAVNKSELFTFGFPSSCNGVLGANGRELSSWGVFFGCHGSVRTD